MVTFAVKPLSLHHRVHELPSLERIRAETAGAEAAFRAAGAGRGGGGGEEKDGGGAGGGGDDFGGGEEGESAEAEAPAASPLAAALAERAGRWTVLVVTGGFSLRMAHDWVGQCLPEVPPRLSGAPAGGGPDGPGGGEEGEGLPESLSYVNAFTGARLLSLSRPVRSPVRLVDPVRTRTDQ